MAPVVSSTPSLVAGVMAVNLPRYAQIVDYSEAAFFGVNQDGQREYACRTIWSYLQRAALARELLAAQGEIGKVAAFPLVPTFYTDEQQPFRTPVILDKCRVIGLGMKAVSDISLGEAITYTTDPVVLTLSVSFTDIDEVHIFHPGTDVEIIPSYLDITAGTLTIWLPKVRMVAVAYEDNPDIGWDYTDDSHFEATVDVKQVYLDTTSQGSLVGYTCQSGALVKVPHALVGLVRNSKLGIVDISLCACIPRNMCETSPKYYLVNYLAGLKSLDPHAEDIVVRLAHSRLPNEPCGCDFLKGQWERDRNVPDVLDTERLNCPWGLSDGAFQAYKFAQTMAIRQGGSLS